jgi:alpha-amylase
VAPRISLALVLHNHQPVGNFGWVIEENWQRAYEPMLAALERHPGVRVGLHYTGPLLQWLRQYQSAALERIVALARRGQVELLGGAWYEPILVSLPAADRHGQLVRMADEVERMCGVRPRGAWLAERVWEPSLAFDLANAGYEYTIVDDNHLRGAAVSDDEMWGTFAVDDQGKRLIVFGTEQGLRYTIPWRPVGEVIQHLRRHATVDGRRVGMMGDDGEKFGGWPDTFEWCWGVDRWVEAFFTALEENADWLSTVRPSDWLDREPPAGRIAIPTTSYIEMTEWALPPTLAPAFHSVLERARESGDASLPFLRGGTWRAFQARYREVNDLHKQMLRVSDKVAAMADGPARDRAREHLYRGQSNDAYWHGLFGGIYLPDLRLAVLRELIAAEDLADAGQIRGGTADFDLDGIDEVLLSGPGQSLMIDLAEGAGVGAWDLLASQVAIASVLRRRPEAYHESLRRAAAVAAERIGAGAAAPSSPHDAVTVKESGLERLLVYDRHERRGGLVHLIDPTEGRRLGPAELAEEAFEDVADFSDSPFVVVPGHEGGATVHRDGGLAVAGSRRPVSVTKRFELGGTRLAPSLAVTVDVAAPGLGSLAVELDLEWGFCLLGGGGNPHAWYQTAGGDRTPHDGTGDLADAPSVAFGNDHLGVRVDAVLEPPARVTWHPIETVSNSEAGFERIYQGSALHLRWPIVLDGPPTTTRVHFAVTQSHDRTRDDDAL